MSDELGDIGEYHPYADMLLEEHYRKKIAELEEELQAWKDTAEARLSTIWEAKKTVTTVTDARAWVIIELMVVNGKPGDSLDSTRITSILKNYRKEDIETMDEWCKKAVLRIRLPDKKKVNQLVIDVINRIPELDERFRKDQLPSQAKKIWRVIRDC